MKVQIWGVILFAFLLIYACNSKQKMKNEVNDESSKNLSHNKKKPDTIRIEERVRLLESYYFKAQKEDIYKDSLFEIFPGKFHLFKEIFGYTEINGDFRFGPLYESSEKFIEYFIWNSQIESSRLYKKIIEISIGGKWQADAVNYFQSNMIYLVQENINTFTKLLASHSNDEVLSFWYFYFDGTYPSETIPNELEKIKIQDERIYELMLKAHRQVLLNKQNP